MRDKSTNKWKKIVLLLSLMIFLMPLERYVSVATIIVDSTVGIPQNMEFGMIPGDVKAKFGNPSATSTHGDLEYDTTLDPSQYYYQQCHCWIQYGSGVTSIQIPLERQLVDLSRKMVIMKTGDASIKVDQYTSETAFKDQLSHYGISFICKQHTVWIKNTSFVIEFGTIPLFDNNAKQISSSVTTIY